MVHYLYIHENHGYLSGALWLVLLIFLYCWTLDRLTKWYAKSVAKKPAQAQES